MISCGVCFHHALSLTGLWRPMFLFLVMEAVLHHQVHGGQELIWFLVLLKDGMLVSFINNSRHSYSKPPSKRWIPFTFWLSAVPLFACTVGLTSALWVKFYAADSKSKLNLNANPLKYQSFRYQQSREGKMCYFWLLTINRRILYKTCVAEWNLWKG